MGSDEHAVSVLHATWIEAVNAGDLGRLLTLATDDVVFINPGQAPFGRDRFSAAFTEAHHRARIQCRSELEEIVAVGSVAYTRSRDALSVADRTTGHVAEFAGYRMTIYRKQADGRWLLARDAHTVSPLENDDQR
jgi:uncharacterized protein (TIGR02246 family)